jgi:hypothetical protein
MRQQNPRASSCVQIGNQPCLRRKSRRLPGHSWPSNPASSPRWEVSLTWALHPTGTLHALVVQQRPPRAPPASITPNCGAGMAPATELRAHQKGCLKHTRRESTICSTCTAKPLEGNTTRSWTPKAAAPPNAVNFGDRRTTATSQRCRGIGQVRDRGEFPPARRLHAAKTLDGFAAQLRAPMAPPPPRTTLAGAQPPPAASRQRHQSPITRSPPQKPTRARQTRSRPPVALPSPSRRLTQSNRLMA